MRADGTDLQQSRLHPIVQIGREVRDLIRQIDDLRFQRRALAQEKPGQLRVFLCLVIA